MVVIDGRPRSDKLNPLNNGRYHKNIIVDVELGVGSGNGCTSKTHCCIIEMVPSKTTEGDQAPMSLVLHRIVHRSHRSPSDMMCCFLDPLFQRTLLLVGLSDSLASHECGRFRSVDASKRSLVRESSPIPGNSSLLNFSDLAQMSAVNRQ